jgi:hypothetical protein
MEWRSRTPTYYRSTGDYREIKNNYFDRFFRIVGTEKMLFERPVSLATTGISLAIMIPEFNALLEQPNQVPSTALIVGAVISAIGIYVGSTTASTYYKRLGRTLRLAVWGLLGLGMTICTCYFGIRVQEWWHKLILFGTGCLPLFAHLAVLFQGWRGGSLWAGFRE